MSRYKEKQAEQEIHDRDKEEVHAVVSLEAERICDPSFREQQEYAQDQPGDKPAPSPAVCADLPDFTGFFPRGFIQECACQKKQRREKDAVPGIAADRENCVIDGLEERKPADKSEVTVSAQPEDPERRRGEQRCSPGKMLQQERGQYTAQRRGGKIPQMIECPGEKIIRRKPPAVSGSPPE